LRDPAVRRQWFVHAAGNVVTGVRVSWASSNPSAATIDSATGLATGVTAGVTYISATAGNVTARVWLRVLPDEH
jgi:uncharacterized protein YjdB